MAGTDLRTEKRALRRLIRARWREVDPTSRQRGSLRICRQVMSLVGEGLTLAYMALPDEVDLGVLLPGLAAQGRLVLPRVTPDGLVLHRVGDLVSDVHPGVLNIMEPRADLPTVAAKDLTAVVVPGRAFSRRGERLGRGGGYYDRLLTEAGADVLRIAVGLELQVVDELPVEAHDVQMHMLLTERRHVALGGGHER